MTNIQFANNFLQRLTALGLEQVCICAGSRNSPLVEVLDRQTSLKVFSFFEEREAGFFAYQQTKEHQKLTAVITTSGTAVAELLPACIESYYKEVPLIIISADRPKSFRASGAPQSIEQVAIFSHYAETLDLDTQDHLDFSLPKRRPQHFNLCFSEPLIDGDLPVWQKVQKVSSLPLQETPKLCSDKILNPLVIVGDIYDPQESIDALNILKTAKAPILLESTSNLRGSIQSDYVLQSQDLPLEPLLRAQKIQSIVRLGGVPTTSLWRRLETKYKDMPVYNLTKSKFSGLSRPTSMLSYQDLFLKNDFSDEMLAKDRHLQQSLSVLLKKYPKSEAALIHQLSLQIQSSDCLYLGNSLPIREWDIYSSTSSTPLRIGSNRGANGIDGQLSSFIGFSHPNKRNIGIFGDLTAMYGMAALWILPQMPDRQEHVFVIINNSGGQIFSQMYTSKTYINSHPYTFEPLADFWKIPYCKYQNDLPTKTALVEVLPDIEQTRAFQLELLK